jgi:hypothetical protein
MQPEDNQLYVQAQRQFTEARLRKDSGAAIPEHEFANDRKTYFAQPGDSPDVIERKKMARENLLRSLRMESGRAFNEYFGAEAGDGGGGAGGPEVGATKRAANGRMLRFDGRGWVDASGASGNW